MGEGLEGAALNGGRGTPKVPVREWLGEQMESRPRHWKTKHCLETILIGLEKNAKRKVQSTTRKTEFFVVGIFSVILVKFAILVGTKSLGKTTQCIA